jgi:hypothetical protein
MDIITEYSALYHVHFQMATAGLMARFSYMGHLKSCHSWVVHSHLQICVTFKLKAMNHLSKNQMEEKLMNQILYSHHIKM